MHPLADWVLKNTKYRKVATIGMDYAFGYETVGGFQRVFEEGGGQIVQKVWTPLNTNDFAPFLSQIKRDSDAVVSPVMWKKRSGAFFRLVKCTTSRPPWQAAPGGTRHGQGYQGRCAGAGA